MYLYKTGTFLRSGFLLGVSLRGYSCKFKSLDWFFSHLNRSTLYVRKLKESKDPNADLSQKKGEGEEEMAPIDKVSNSLAHEQFVLFCFRFCVRNAHPVSLVDGKDRGEI